MISIELHSTSELFTPPTPDPFAGRFATTSGVERILEGARQHREEPLAVAIRVTETPAHTEDTVQSALRAYWAASADELRQRRRRIWSRGFKELAVGVLFLAVCLALSASLSSVGWRTEWFGQFAIEGVIIVGWIALWHPVDMLLFEPWPLNSDLRALGRLSNATIRVDPPE